MYFYVTSFIYSGKRHFNFQALHEVSVSSENLFIEQPSQLLHNFIWFETTTVNPDSFTILSL
jgi:hypothetical protein